MNTLVTTQSVTDDFKAWLSRVFDGYTFKDASGQRVPLNIFSQNLPLPDGDEEDVELASVPYAIAHIVGGKVTSWKDPQQCEVILFLCTYDNSCDNQGYRDILGMKEKILEAMLKDPHVGTAEILLPIDWNLNDANTYPFNFGAFSFKVGTRKIDTREDRFA
jgi:hypothetical protein